MFDSSFIFCSLYTEFTHRTVAFCHSFGLTWTKSMQHGSCNLCFQSWDCFHWWLQSNSGFCSNYFPEFIIFLATYCWKSCFRKGNFLNGKPPTSIPDLEMLSFVRNYFRHLCKQSWSWPEYLKQTHWTSGMASLVESGWKWKFISTCNNTDELQSHLRKQT